MGRQATRQLPRQPLVTREEWATRGSPSLLLRLMQKCNATERKLRLVRLAFIQNQRDREELTEIEQRLITAMERATENPDDRDELDRAVVAVEAQLEESVKARECSGYHRLDRLLACAKVSSPLPGIYPMLDLDLASSIIRDIFNPFAPNGAPFRHRPLLRSLSEAIYQERAFDRLPILADALEEEGCTSAEMLGHCREPGVHVRGCWVVDLLLDKE